MAKIADIVKAASKIIFSNEGNYGSVNINDNGALSIGKVQWNAGRALELCRNIAKAVGRDRTQQIIGKALYDEIMNNGTNWDTRTADIVEAAFISELLETKEGKEEQDKLADKDITSYINKGNSYGLTNAGALIYFADGVNQYGTASKTWKNIAADALKNGGDIEAIYAATCNNVSKYLARRQRVYAEVKLLAISKETLGEESTEKGQNNMSVTISNCGHDENGRYSGGAAGDQRGDEWVLRSWYNRPWDCVLRFEDANIANLIASMARAAAENNLIGYDQNQRTTFWQHLAASNYDPAQITIKCEADCSSGVGAIVKGAGYRLGNAAMKNVSKDIYTGNEKAALKAAGAIVLTSSKYLTSDAYLRAGDILLNEGHHTAIAVTNGVYGGSASSGGSTPTPAFNKTGTATCTGNGVRVRAGGSTNDAILGSANKGTNMDIDGTKQNGWHHVRVNGVVGYMHPDYVSVAASAPSAPATSEFNATGTATCTGNGVRIRNGASTQSTILGSLNKGNRMELDGTTQNGWYHVRTGGVVGYMYGEYVQPDAPATAARTHKVVSGDTLSAIARKYGTTVNAIVTGNRAKYPKITANFIVVGWELSV